MSKYRYLTDFDTSKLVSEYHDVIIIGSGIAGVYTALEISGENDVAILTKETLDMSNSALAQGGIAVSLDKGDSPELHFKDTLYAGAGLCNEETVWVLVKEAAENIDRLCKFGVNFDKKNGDQLALTREAAHSKNRIIHAGDTTGKEVCDTLIAAVKERENIMIHERTFVVDLLVEAGACRGILAFDEDSSSLKLYISRIVVCATGGFGQLYSNTTNPEVATGDGACMAYRAGAELMDLEFIQFHPTVLYHPENKSFLISEAVRGEGAILKNVNGKRFMPEYHELNELAPRDVVSRSIYMEMKKTNSTNVFLDITFKGREYLENRFPNIFKTCLGYGIDISKDMIPVAPAEHYCMGGIRASVDGTTNIKGFFTCGESACNGIHGANRLASNSMLEGLVFGYKIGKQINSILAEKEQEKVQINICYTSNRITKEIDADSIIKDIQNEMTLNVGIVRNEKGLLKALQKVNRYTELLNDAHCGSLREFELHNMVLLSRLVIEAALEREESRGAHYRSDFSATDDANWKKNIMKNIIKRD